MSGTTSKTRRSATERFDSLEQEVYLNLWRTYDRLRALEDKLFGQFELTAQQYNVLRLLEAHTPNGLPTLDVASRLVSRAPDITRIVDRLEQRGMLARERRPENRRVVLLHLTPQGSALLTKIHEPLQACHARQLGHLRATDLRQLVEMLRAARQPHEDAESHWRGL